MRARIGATWHTINGYRGTLAALLHIFASSLQGAWVQLKALSCPP